MSDKTKQIIILLGFLVIFAVAHFRYIYLDYNEKDQSKYSNPEVCTYVLYSDKELVFKVKSIKEEVNKNYYKPTNAIRIIFNDNDFILLKSNYLSDEDYRKLKLVQVGDTLSIRFKGWTKPSFNYSQAKFEIDFSSVKNIKDNMAY